MQQPPQPGVRSPFRTGFGIGCGIIIAFIALPLIAFIVFPLMLATCVGAGAVLNEHESPTEVVQPNQEEVTFGLLCAFYGDPIQDKSYDSAITMPVDGVDTTYNREVVFESHGQIYHVLLLDERVVYSD